jgi:DNA-binding transcriptional regulator YhcF (GntR family)
MNGTLKHVGRWFIQGIYRDIMHSPRLSVGAKAMFVALMGFVSSGSPCPFPSLDHLGRILNINPRTAQKYIDELAKAGLLEKEQRVKHGRFASNSYTLYDAFPESRRSVITEGSRSVIPEVEVADNSEANADSEYESTDVIKTDISNNDVDFTDGDKPDDKGKATLKEKKPSKKEKDTTITRASAAGVAGVVSNSPEASPSSPSAQSATIFLRGWKGLVKQLEGHTLHLTPEIEAQVETWFEEHPKWYPHDVVWIAFQAMLKVKKNPRPKKGEMDPYLYSRFAHSPQWFVPTKKDGICKIFETAQEVGYHLDLEPEEINQRISAYFKA